jgi:hypothetical protein
MTRQVNSSLVCSLSDGQFGVHVANSVQDGSFRYPDASGASELASDRPLEFGSVMIGPALRRPVGRVPGARIGASAQCNCGGSQLIGRNNVCDLGQSKQATGRGRAAHAIRLYIRVAQGAGDARIRVDGQASSWWSGVQVRHGECWTKVHSFRAIACAAAASVFLLTWCSPPSVAHAGGEDSAINGTFTATSNGDWAQTNDAFHDEVTVRSRWTISTKCSTPIDCLGTVTSDQGWTAPIYTTSDVWYVKRDLQAWEPCPDGSSATGHQLYRFSAVAEDGTLDRTSTTYAGVDQTSGSSGACGKNLQLVVELPFKLVKVA